MQVTIIGIDLAKSVFQVCGVNQAGKPVFNRQLRRNRLLSCLDQYPGITIAMEACSGSNFRRRLVEQRTSLINQLRGLLCEYGLVVAQGKANLAESIPDLLEDAESGLTTPARELITLIRDEWREIDARISWFDQEIRKQAREDEAASRLMAIKGVAEKTATAAVAIIGNGQGYDNGRHLAASLGLVPREHSSGGKQQLGGITRRGNRYLRLLLIQGAWSVLRNSRHGKDRLSRWARQVAERRGQHKAVVAVANKLARIIWSMLYHQTAYKAA